jgi:transcriptional regulator
MYTPREFEVREERAMLALMQRYGFATLITAAETGPVVTHLPLVARSDGPGKHRLIGHVARANPHWKLFDAHRESLAIFHGPHGYVSPSLYETPNVPTWNYAVVHAHGAPRIIDEAADVLREMVSLYEGGRERPWTVERLPEGRFDQLQKAIVAFEMPVSRLEGKFKLSQNRSAADARNVADAFARSADSGERELAELMRALPIRTK